ncbi:MAG: alpha/beta fold hydrolase, partial [Phenylobacterium sp.]
PPAQPPRGRAANRPRTLGASWRALRPVRVVGRTPGPGRIALSDFGPASGAPVLMLHSAVTGALLDRGLVRALQRRGFRPIAVERPGFGLTDPASGDPDEVAVADLIDILDTLKLRAVRILARGGEDTALRFAAAHPERMIHSVLINPFTPYALDTRRDGYLNAMKWLLARQPAMIEAVARFLAPRSIRAPPSASSAVPWPPAPPTPPCSASRRCWRTMWSPPGWSPCGRPSASCMNNAAISTGRRGRRRAESGGPG